MEVEADFSQVVCGQKMMEHANDIVCPLPRVDSFINEVVYL